MRTTNLRLILTPITLAVLCGILAFGAWWGYKQITAPLPGKAPTPCVTASAAELASSQVVVRVLNGGYTTGLGGKVSKELQTAGFVVLGSGNTQERVKKTVIVAASDKAPEALLVMGFFKDATIRADKDRAIDGRVDVLIGSEYGGINAEAPKTVKTAGSACLAVLPTPSAAPTTQTPATPTK